MKFTWFFSKLLSVCVFLMLLGCTGVHPDNNGSATAKVTLAGGCFWGMEDLFRQQPGVLDVEVGYTGGHTKRPTYRQVMTGRTGHAEAILVTFDESVTTYEALLRFFFRMHDPTTIDRQGGDIGTQYRSAIFVHNEDQRRIALQVMADEDTSGFWPGHIVTAIEDVGPWWRAENYHQKYLQKNPGGYTCHWVRTGDKAY
jgi:methionine-S-sulfoxide reductase